MSSDMHSDMWEDLAETELFIIQFISNLDLSMSDLLLW